MSISSPNGKLQLSHLVDEAAVIEKRMLQKIEAVRGLAAEFVGNAARALGEAKEAVFEGAFSCP